MAMTPFALSLLGAESMNRRRQGEVSEGETSIPEPVQAEPELTPARTSRRATSYYNSFQTVCSPANDEPPSYNRAARLRPTRPAGNGRENLPKYTCTVAAETKVLLHLESINPLHGVSDCEWKEVYVVLRGTLLSFHRPKDSGPGKLLRSYTLQHAEVGLASDAHHTVLMPQTRLAHLIPSAARRKAWQRDPDLFRAVRQHILRLRVETDQILLADASEDQIHSLIYSIGAGIDISHALDERSIPRQCTVPRRRRRQRVNYTGNLSDPALLEEQERIMREMYPSFAAAASESRPDLEQPVMAAADELSTEAAETPTREEDELDMAAIREDFGAPSPPPSSRQNHTRLRPNLSREATSSSVNATYSADMMYATSSTNFDTFGKWQPPHVRTQQQTQRYIRRCMPILLADSVRASDVLICDGKRVKINWRMEMLEEWELRPPGYKSHGFNDDLGLERTRSISRNSASGSATQRNAQASTSVLGGDGEDQITPAEVGLVNLELSKITSIGSTEKGSPHEAPVLKTRVSHRSNNDIHGVVFCF